MPQKRKTVYVGMSGGVDSSVTAALLVKQGYEVIGVFIRVWEPDGAPCRWRAERRDAMRVAARLDIPLFTLDLSVEYKKRVIDYMIAEYKRGRTPNPDVMCNQQVKFGAFYDWAMARGADYVATGHYARVAQSRQEVARALGREFPVKTVSRQELFANSCLLLRSKDDNKDQTYFLWTLKPEQLPQILFPIGAYTKPEVRKLAKKFNLPNAEKRDSQGLCFVGKIEFKDFLKEFIDTKPGDVIDEKGKVIGHHDGVAFYTIGERHGFTVKSQTSNTKPFYVIERDIEKNRLIVAPNVRSQTSNASNKKEVKLENVNWLINEPPRLIKPTRQYQARVRHRGELLPCQINCQGVALTIKFSGKIPEAIASGQSLVLYDHDICLGGGVIFC
jgi:tRNA-specific 2-thiouridylase